MKKYLPILIICLVAILLRVWWWSYTNHTAEDAHITYQFAKQIARENGFVFNTGQPIYGTTTPLFALLLAGWLLISNDIIMGSKLLGLAAEIGGLVFLYFSFREERTAIIATSVLAISMKLITEEMIGMETSFLLLFMAGSIWGYSKERYYLSGIMCGLLLWTRIDSVVFVAVLFLSYVASDKPFMKFLAGTLVYLPWLIFATLYFGSPIPFTITAKTVAYGINSPSLWTHFTRIVEYLSLPVFVLTIVSMFYKRNPFLSWVFVSNILFLVVSGSTFFDRYFYTITTLSLIMVAMLVSNMRNVFGKVLILLVLVFPNWNSQIAYYKDIQISRHDVLKDIGLWLNANTFQDSTIQLEPLGYIGYYADRTMLDDVGLITPRVVELHKQRIRGESFYLYLWTDYILLQCHQADKVMDDFSRYYEMLKLFDNGRLRSCYEVWERRF